MPRGSTVEGRPVGVQLVAAPRQERRLLELPHAFEQATCVGERRPTFGFGAAVGEPGSRLTDSGSTSGEEEGA